MKITEDYAIELVTMVSNQPTKLRLLQEAIGDEQFQLFISCVLLHIRNRFQKAEDADAFYKYAKDQHPDFAGAVINTGIHILDLAHAIETYLPWTHRWARKLRYGLLFRRYPKPDFNIQITPLQIMGGREDPL
jgi:hypothetical protein